MAKAFLAKQAKALDKMLTACLKQQTLALKSLATIGEDCHGDPADIAHALLDQEIILRGANGCANEIFKVSQAILNIKNGTYGICASCNEPIAIKRLKAMPTATKCIACKDAEEKSRK